MCPGSYFRCEETFPHQGLVAFSHSANYGEQIYGTCPLEWWTYWPKSQSPHSDSERFPTKRPDKRPTVADSGFESLADQKQEKKSKVVCEPLEQGLKVFWTIVQYINYKL